MIDKRADARPSIHSVAAYAGVSIATVSKVMQGVPTVRKENVIAVQNAIEALGYRINPLGAELRRGQRKLVGVIVEHFETLDSARLLSALERDVESRGYTLLVASSRGSEDRAVELVGRMQDWRVAGLVIESVAGWAKAALLLNDGPPAVFLGNASPQGTYDMVVHDVGFAIRDATRINNGATGAIFLPQDPRASGRAEAFARFGAPVVRDLADLDGASPILLIASAEDAKQFRDSVDRETLRNTTYAGPDFDGISSAALSLLFRRMEDPQAPGELRRVPMKVHSADWLP